ncbi:MAG: helix-turn-helix transcriptional regulator, partial [Oscillospiraceae bacterium]|nr:helix-turn-helix transcriptional regulator [Oscillospiraceae bacterium]
MNNSQVVATIIKERAKEKGLTLKKLLEDCELSRNALSSMQAGGYMPRVENLCKIADYLDCSLDYLLGRTDELTVNTGIQQNITAGGNNNGSNNI